MRHLICYFSLILGISLSVTGCGSSAPAKKKATKTAPSEMQEWKDPTLIFIGPGAGEEAITAPAPQVEWGSYYQFACQGATQLQVGQDQTTCGRDEHGAIKCGENTRTCHPTVSTKICAFDALTSEPRDCVDVVLNADEPVTVPVTGPYMGLLMVDGSCLDAVSLADPVPPNRYYWRMPDGSVEDMFKGGGSTSPGADTWYDVPVGGCQ